MLYGEQLFNYYEFISIEELIACLNSKKKLPNNSILLTFDVTGNTYEENVVQYKFWYSFLFMLFAIALISSVVRYFNLVNNYGITPNIRGVMFPLVGLVLIILRTIFEAY